MYHTWSTDIYRVIYVVHAWLLTTIGHNDQCSHFNITMVNGHESIFIGCKKSMITAQCHIIYDYHMHMLVLKCSIGEMLKVEPAFLYKQMESYFNLTKLGANTWEEVGHGLEAELKSNTSASKTMAF